MSTRLKVRLAIACVALVIYFVIHAINPSRVTFSPANMSIDPGKGWKQVKVPATSQLCSPSLVNQSGVINGLLLDEDLTDLKPAAEKLQANLAAAGKTPADGFNQEEFTTASGLAGIHFSYTAKSVKPDRPDVKTHHFITRNMHGRCVSVIYVTSPDVEASSVVEAIRKTLRVE